MYRNYTCGELRLAHVGQEPILAGWVQTIRNHGAMTFVDIRDRYGITQLVADGNTPSQMKELVDKLGREYVIQVKGTVRERSSKNPKIATGEIELDIKELAVLNKAAVPPFTIQDDSDGGDELRMKFRYLDLRREAVRKNLELRARMAHVVRNYLNNLQFIETETPVLIKSTPEGARDFVVPSRMNPNQFYALPQSPQTFKDVLNTFEGLARHLFIEIKGIDPGDFPRMTFADAMKNYGCDKPDLRFGMIFKDLTNLVKGKDFKVFDEAEYVVGICVPGCGEYTRKQLDALTELVKRPQVGAKGLIHAKVNDDGSVKSSVDKYYNQDELGKWRGIFGAKPGDLILILYGDKDRTLPALSVLRLEMGRQCGLMDRDNFKPLWVVDFPLLEWNEESGRFHAMHHPFTSPKPEDILLLDSDPGKVRANAYDLVINGVEIGGGSVRIFDSELQAKMFKTLGFTKQEADNQFGFLMEAFKYGAPPHAGIAFGFDRLVSMFAGLDSIRDVIAFPKNNSGRDVMNDSPSEIAQIQLDELFLSLVTPKGKS